MSRGSLHGGCLWATYRPGGVAWPRSAGRHQPHHRVRRRQYGSAPIVAIAGQGATTRLHKESHQILQLVNLFHPISKYATQILEPEIVPEIVRKAFKVAQTEKPGGAFIEFPENIAEAKVEGTPIEVQTAYNSAAPDTRSSRQPRSFRRPRLP
jgi:acetolactate synthase-1/2/3 large subunit